MLDAGNRSAGGALVVAAPAGGPALASGGTEMIAFTAQGTTSTPVRCTFTDSARRHRGHGGTGASAGADTSPAAGGWPGPGPRGHDGWPGRWRNPGWLKGGWLTGGWLNRGWPSRGGAGGGWPGDGQAGQGHGWPVGR